MGSLPKAKKKNIPKSVHEMSKEMLQETLKKKRECNAKALDIVEKMCHTCVDENWFLENLQFINQCHFDDVTIERSILKMCGYPLCDQQLKNIPAQQYHISVRYNKVFDITERKNFCSSCCYKSATYVKKQLFTSPLWFRDQENIPKYTILKSSQSSLGEEVVFFPDKITPEPGNIIYTKNLNRTELLDQQVQDLENKYSNLTIDSSEKVFLAKIKPKSGNVKEINISNVAEHINEIESPQKVLPDETLLKSDREISTFEEKQSRLDNSSKNEKDKEKNESNETLCGDDKDSNKDKIPKKHDLENTKRTKPKTEKGKPVDTTAKVEKSIFEWFSLHTLFYLFGEEKLKELFCDKADEIKQVLNSKLSMASARDKIDRMIQLYGILDTDSFNKKESKMNLKPLPDYAALKEEKNAVEIKVKAFYQGQLEIKQSLPEQKERKEKETSTDSEVIYLPLVDAHAQIPLRRKILLDKLVRVLPDLVKVFGSDYTLQLNEVRDLITTFTLDAYNITFKPCEWYLVGIIIIKLLSLKDKDLETIIKLEPSRNQILLLLSSYNLQQDYLDNLLIRLTDSKNLVKKLNEMNS